MHILREALTEFTERSGKEDRLFDVFLKRNSYQVSELGENVKVFVASQAQIRHKLVERLEPMLRMSPSDEDKNVIEILREKNAKRKQMLKEMGGLISEQAHLHNLSLRRIGKIFASKVKVLNKIFEQKRGLLETKISLLEEKVKLSFDGLASNKKSEKKNETASLKVPNLVFIDEESSTKIPIKLRPILSLQSLANPIIISKVTGNRVQSDIENRPSEMVNSLKSQISTLLAENQNLTDHIERLKFQNILNLSQENSPPPETLLLQDKTKSLGKGSSVAKSDDHSLALKMGNIDSMTKELPQSNIEDLHRETVKRGNDDVNLQAKLDLLQTENTKLNLENKSLLQFRNIVAQKVKNFTEMISDFEIASCSKIEEAFETLQVMNERLSFAQRSKVFKFDESEEILRIKTELQNIVSKPGATRHLETFERIFHYDSKGKNSNEVAPKKTKNFEFFDFLSAKQNAALKKKLKAPNLAIDQSIGTFYRLTKVPLEQESSFLKNEIHSKYIDSEKEPEDLYLSSEDHNNPTENLVQDDLKSTNKLPTLETTTLGKYFSKKRETSIRELTPLVSKRLLQPQLSATKTRQISEAQRFFEQKKNSMKRSFETNVLIFQARNEVQKVHFSTFDFNLLSCDKKVESPNRSLSSFYLLRQNTSQPVEDIRLPLPKLERDLRFEILSNQFLHPSKSRKVILEIVQQKGIILPPSAPSIPNLNLFVRDEKILNQVGDLRRELTEAMEAKMNLQDQLDQMKQKEETFEADNQRLKDQIKELCQERDSLPFQPQMGSSKVFSNSIALLLSTPRRIFESSKYASRLLQLSEKAEYLTKALSSLAYTMPKFSTIKTKLQRLAKIPAEQSAREEQKLSLVKKEIGALTEQLTKAKDEIELRSKEQATLSQELSAVKDKRKSSELKVANAKLTQENEYLRSEKESLFADKEALVQIQRQANKETSRLLGEKDAKIKELALQVHELTEANDKYAESAIRFATFHELVEKLTDLTFSAKNLPDIEALLTRFTKSEKTLEGLERQLKAIGAGVPRASLGRKLSEILNDWNFARNASQFSGSSFYHEKPEANQPPAEDVASLRNQVEKLSARLEELKAQVKQTLMLFFANAKRQIGNGGALSSLSQLLNFSNSEKAELNDILKTKIVLPEIQLVD